jgi:hydrogenase maturation protein HypF
MTEPRVRITVTGAVQGVGFRPLVYRYATTLGLDGWVRNEGSKVVIETQGARAHELADAIRDNPPPHARIEGIDKRDIPPETDTPRGFRIIQSSDDPGAARALPDLATCADCLREVFDPASRFFRYPFTNCTQCGPRYSIMEGTPYDRARTSMRRFTMCEDCRTEYTDPANRRFHAQPTACPRCGPCLQLTDKHGAGIPGDPLKAAAQALRDGKVLALKGLGGFQLLADATQEAVVRTLRERKQRPHKPLAVMARDVKQARECCRISDGEAALLQSPAGPIVLLERVAGVLPDLLAPGLDTLGVLLPTTPLHHLLMHELDAPVVCTSGNLSDEPICIDNDEARERLHAIADLFLVHDRPVVRAVDDSVARVIDGGPQVLRLARGYAPLSLPLESDAHLLATGAHLKSTVAVAADGRATISQHLGDLENTLSVDAMRAAAADLREFHGINPARVAHDVHPDYASTHHAHEQSLPLVPVQHHVAHALACMLEHNLRGPVLAVVWDGTGLADDAEVRGSEFLRVARSDAGVVSTRVAQLRPFPLPGGDAAARDTRRALAGLMFEAGMPVDGPVRQQLEQGLNAPRCSSAGRLFDAFAALLEVCADQTYEAQAPAMLESLADGREHDAYPLPLRDGLLDWEPMLRQALADRQAGAAAGVVAARVHAGLADAIVSVAREADEQTVLLTGGCFLNRVLTELALDRLRAAGFEAVIARRIPPDDGGISAGQLVAATEHP